MAIFPLFIRSSVIPDSCIQAFPNPNLGLYHSAPINKAATAAIGIAIGLIGNSILFYSLLVS